MAGGRGNRRKDRDFYEGSKRPWACRPCPEGFRETYLEIGWDCEYHYATNWRVICRWIDECGGQELCDERKRVLKRKGHREICHVHHVKGWTAAKLEALRR